VDDEIIWDAVQMHIPGLLHTLSATLSATH